MKSDLRDTYHAAVEEAGRLSKIHSPHSQDFFFLLNDTPNLAHVPCSLTDGISVWVEQSKSPSDFLSTTSHDVTSEGASTARVGIFSSPF